MPGRLAASAFAAALLLGAALHPARADWSHDPTQNDAVCVAGQDQLEPIAVSDGQGGTIVAWRDRRAGVNDLYAQRFDARGEALWTSGGALVHAAVHSTNSYVVTPDGEGGCFCAWADCPTTTCYAVMAQHVGADGQMLWGDGVILVEDQSHFSNQPQVVTDGAGGAIVCWTDGRNEPAGYWQDIYAQRLDAGGEPLWAPDGVAVCAWEENQDEPRMVSAGAGGAIIGWQDQRAGESYVYDLYVQRLDGSGVRLWGDAGGLPLCTWPSSQSKPACIRDGSGGAVFAWEDFDSGIWRVVAQRIGPDGAPLWSPYGGVLVSGEQTSPSYHVLASDGAGGAYFAWTQHPAGRSTNLEVHAQRVRGSGAACWAAGGIQVAPFDESQGFFGLDMIATPDDDAVLTWCSARFRRPEYAIIDIYGQKLSGEGERLWAMEGVPVTLAAGNQQCLTLAATDGSGAVCFWGDDRKGEGQSDIYMQRVDRFGHPGDPAPWITAATDFPQDQGGVIMVDWTASYLDTWSDPVVDAYSIWKRLGDGPHGADAAAGPPAAVPDAAAAAALPVSVLRALRAGGWCWAGETPAACQELYSFDAPSYGDSTADGIIFTDYKVLAHGGDHVFWESQVVTGYSVDNLAPGAPLNLTAVAGGSDVALVWEPSGWHDEDLSHYRVYRGDAPGFLPNADSFLGEAAGTGYLDEAPGAGVWYYCVAGCDVHGNEGEASAAAAAEVLTAAPGQSAPAALALLVNAPNPFNPGTRIVFELPAPGPTRLEVITCAGRRVAVLVDGVLPAGRHERTWQGRDDAGRLLPSGVYLYRLEAGDQVLTRKMTLLK
ncbi:MAG: hypothetical protein JW819_13510 [Candidatus Krumholzibacteriota bacterium]|nr:hypothetical protein [Candidatus Krumholzibacteriota bacterium]